MSGQKDDGSTAQDTAGTSHSDMEVFDPQWKAHQLRLAGKSWVEIAKETGYPSGPACQTSVTNYLQQAAVRTSAAKRQEALDLELERLDTLQAAYWDAALLGDDKSAQVILKCIALRCKVLGIEGGEISELKGGSKTILVLSKEKTYAQTLKDIAAGKYAEKEEDDD